MPNGGNHGLEKVCEKSTQQKNISREDAKAQSIAKQTKDIRLA